MSYKPMLLHLYRSYIKSMGQQANKGKIDWNLYDANNHFIYTIKIIRSSRKNQKKN